MRITHVIVALALSGLGADPALSQDYPNRPVNFVVPFAPGGGTDVLGRLLGQKLGERFGKPFVVENRPGAGTLYKQLPYNPGKDLALSALICSVPFVLVVNPDLPVNSVADLVKLAKERPLSYGSGGPGAFHHLMGELFKTTFGVPMTHVPYRGSLPALNDLVAGHIQVMFSDMAPAYPLVQAGKVGALGVTTAQRVASALEIPPL